MTALNGMYPSELKSLMDDIGEKSFRAQQLFRFFHVEKKTNLKDSSVLPKALVQKLQDIAIDQVEVAKKYQSKMDGTVKYLLRLQRGHLVEAVFLKNDGTYNTLCISTQIGCKMGCVFCASTKARFARNITAAEMAGEVYVVERDMGEKITNIVLMGIGEPLDNYAETIRFLRLMHEPDGANMSYRNMTLSTSGIAERIYDLADEEMPINLSISLHNAFQVRREGLMPIAKKYDLDSLLKAQSYYFEKTGRRVSFEYTLIHGVNDTQEDVLELGKLFSHKNVHINLIALNEIDEYTNKPPDSKSISAFAKELKHIGITTTIRKPQGRDINGACGQLRRLEEGGLNLKTAVNTNVGKKRMRNEDTAYIGQYKDLTVLFIADGMGGHKAGEVASKLAVDTLKNLIEDEYREEEDLENFFVNAIKKANRSICKAAESIDCEGMGTTFVALVIRKEDALILHIGDSRAYLFRDGKLEQLTHDHSLVNELSKKEPLDTESYKRLKHIITRYLGTDGDVEVDRRWVKVKDLDRFLLCTDGLTDEVTDAEMEHILRSEKDIQKNCNELVNLALDHGGNDNITICMMEYEVRI